MKAGNYRPLRSFSITEDFEPGGQVLHFAQMDFDTRSAVEKTWREIEDADRVNFDPVHSMFSLVKTRKLAGASGWENVRLILGAISTFTDYCPVCTNIPMLQTQVSSSRSSSSINTLSFIKELVH